MSLVYFTYFWQVSPVMTSAVEALLRGLSGSWTCFLFGANTYIADVTRVEERTYRLGVINAMSFVGSPIGVIFGGMLRKHVGFFYLFMVCTGLNILALLIGNFCVRNTAVESKLKPSQFVQAVKTVFKKRADNKRAILFMMASITPLFSAAFIGEYSVLYFFMRFKFHIGELEFGNYCSFKMLVIFAGTFISLIICFKVLKMSDAMIGFLSTVTQILAALGNCFSVHIWQVYFFPVLDFMHGASGTAARSIITKNVDSDELSQVFSVIASVDVLVPIIVFPVYNLVYKNTFLFMPGAFFLVSVFIASIVLVLFVSEYFMEKRQQLSNRLKEKDKHEKVGLPLI